MLVVVLQSSATWYWEKVGEDILLKRHMACRVVLVLVLVLVLRS